MDESKPNKKPSSDKETTVLHLSKFKTETDREGTDEGATMFIKKVAKSTVRGSRAPVVVPQAAGSSLSAEELLGIVAYCYAKGVYSSADIERKMVQDPEFREAIGGVVPDPQAIRRFRRLNRESIQEVLEKFYARLGRPSSAVETVARPPGKGSSSPPSADKGEGAKGSAVGLGADSGDSASEDSTELFVKQKAINKLDEATFIDRMSEED